ncbi:unnamed protein product [Trifolium pratense]|uniref:Uncharacterized protein n=1 Tax=Trifolium pratense TaxID=57577 RepID=A0ACB0IW94_TRIPR|nr:unnamed protein product [Trifolium pratense]
MNKSNFLQISFVFVFIHFHSCSFVFIRLGFHSFSFTSFSWVCDVHFCVGLCFFVWVFILLLLGVFIVPKICSSYSAQLTAYDFKDSGPKEEEHISFPQTQSKLQSLVDLIMWRDVSRSAFVFGIGTFIIISSSYARDINLRLQIDLH